MIEILKNELFKKNINIKNIKYLLFMKRIDIHVDNEFLFRFVCEEGYLEVAKWLWEVSQRETKEIGRETKKIDIHVDNEYAFCWTCYGGHFEIVKWLWEISNKSINIHVLDENAFRWACEKGHLEIAKWLWKVSLKSIDIHAKHDFVFKMGGKNILKWLNSLE